MKQAYRLLILRLYVASAAVAVPGGAMAASPSSTEAQLAKPLTPAITDQLRKSKIPVYLPCWLPSATTLTTTGKVYPHSSVESDRYSVSLAGRPGDAPASATCFYVSGSTDKCPNMGKKVDLGNSRFGYLQTTGNLATIQWSNQKYSYTMGMASSTQDLIRSAKSTIHVF